LAFATSNGPILLAAVVLLAYVAYGSLATAELLTALTASRTVEPTPAPPGRPVAVTLTVTNDSDRTLSDVRVVDGVPGDLAVMDGSPRVGTTLEPGESVTLEYTMVARRGDHDFDPPRVRLWSLGAGGGGDGPPSRSTATSNWSAGSTPRRHRSPTMPAITWVRSRPTARAGAWSSTRRASTATATTRAGSTGATTPSAAPSPPSTTGEPWSASIVAAVDAREVCRVVPGPGRPTAVELEAYAATHAVGEFLRTGHDVAVAVVGLDGPGPVGSTGSRRAVATASASRALERFELQRPTRETTVADPEAQFTQLLACAPGAQIALFSPLLDDAPVDAVEAWLAHDHSVVVLSPDVITDNTVSGQYEQVRRGTRLARCQAAGARALDWRRGTPPRSP